MPSQTTNSGIVTDSSSGERHIPESVRADGSTRKAIKIRPGYRPPEDVEVYKNQSAEAFRVHGQGPPPGADGLARTTKLAFVSASAAKNAKRKEARKKAKEAGGKNVPTTKEDSSAEAPRSETAKMVDTYPEVERQKKGRALKKKLKQARELRNKKETGGLLLPEQIAKVIKISELIRELEALGFKDDEQLQDDTAAKYNEKDAS